MATYRIMEVHFKFPINADEKTIQEQINLSRKTCIQEEFLDMKTAKKHFSWYEVSLNEREDFIGVDCYELIEIVFDRKGFEEDYILWESQETLAMSEVRKAVEEKLKNKAE